MAAGSPHDTARASVHTHPADRVAEMWPDGSVSDSVRHVLVLAEQVGDHEIRRRMGTLLRTPLTVQQLRCMTILVVHGTASPQQLSTLLQVSPATMTGIADRLVRAGMITRHVDDRDGRGRTIIPTQAGQQVVRSLMSLDIESDVAVLSGLTEDELAGLRAGLAGIVRELQRLGEPGGVDGNGH
ncbi:MarR family transcriptional regulator [Nakamurella leprariae]|uniref:MarR family transcriptional regulator n=1 Tax=Nakamurella leprariae TaxID=2803911 RepID=A0A938YEJ6_9ACTN|nr:MarR family transcriptional regulator [Nakamurella leprariae]MBM9468394.1 MarR family transcriptional regulator [Nakamurella leprariae]